MDKSGKWLADQFWAGKRWVVLEAGPGIVGIYGCYCDYADAAAVCKKTATVEKNLRIRVLGSFLKELNGCIRGRVEEEERQQVRFAISKYPVRLFASSANWEEELLQGNYYPMVWLKSMHPLLAVKKYIVVLDRVGKLPGRRELYSTSEFPEAMLALEQFVSGRRAWNGALLLVGQLSDGPLNNHPGESKHSNSVIVFYRTECRDAQHMGIVQVHDPSTPIKRDIPVFVRYFTRRRELAFYDGKLKRIRPGDEMDFIDLSVFDFREKVLKEEVGYEAGRIGGLESRRHLL
ncbi:MAG TPA: hypothetical protein VHE34_24925 [Puia sp.]|uniref:hypothetical protein n=1 Tax=Puia sp. TaxID=2045100 RepID=UPI002C0E2E2A|nr:hypothetical protein [Puia sp.]HVU98498.1 hypothetical protein [Puia sp.]